MKITEFHIFLSSFLIVLVWSSCMQVKKGKELSFKPMEIDTLACAIKASDIFGEFEVQIKNISSTKVSFSKPRMLTGADLNTDKEICANSIELQLRWGDNQIAELQYATFKNTEVDDETVTLDPDEMIEIRLNLNDTLIERRCNLVSFGECFSEGDTDIYVTFTLVRLTNKKIETISESNTVKFKGRYIF